MGRAQVRIELVGRVAGAVAGQRLRDRPFVRTGNLVFTAGQVTFDASGKLQFIGKLGREFGIDEGYQAARLCAVNVLAAWIIVQVVTRPDLPLDAPPSCTAKP